MRSATRKAFTRVSLFPRYNDSLFTYTTSQLECSQGLPHSSAVTMQREASGGGFPLSQRAEIASAAPTLLRGYLPASSCPPPQHTGPVSQWSLTIRATGRKINQGINPLFLLSNQLLKIAHRGGTSVFGRLLCAGGGGGGGGHLRTARVFPPPLGRRRLSLQEMTIFADAFRRRRR